MANRPPSFADRLEQAVWRVGSSADPDQALGTAFFVAPGLAVTCAHVVSGAADITLTGGDRQLDVPAQQIMLPADHGTLDLALLRVDDEDLPPFGCVATAVGFDRFTSRGFSVSAPSGRTSFFHRRGSFHARYDLDLAYSIPGAFELAGDMAEPGFSGSPLLANEAGAVVGLVSGGDRSVERSWAIPFHLALGRFPELEQALAWNAANIAAFGTLLNANGFDRSWHDACTSAAEDYRESKAYREPRNVRREGVIGAVGDFIQSAHVALVLVGASGTGKSWLLADLLGSGAVADAFIIPAAELGRDNPVALRDLLQSALQRATKAIGGDLTPPDQDTLEARLRDRAKPAVVFVDGLNEAADYRDFVNRWWPGAVRWCERQGVKLLCTTRPEIWPTLVSALDEPAHQLFKEISREPADKEGQQFGEPQVDGTGVDRCVRLASFTGSEARAAARAYALPEQIEPLLRRHPLLFRIAERIGIDQPNSGVGRLKLFDAYVDKLLGDQFARLDLQTPAPLRRKLSAIASVTERSAGGALEWQKASELVGNDQMLDALLASGLLVAVGQELRFQFDELAGALITVPAEPGALFGPEVLEQPLLQQEHADILLRLEADGREAAFRSAFGSLVRMLGRIFDEARDRDGLHWDRWRFAERATIVANALPAVRAGEIAMVYAALADLAAYAVRYRQFADLVDWIFAAPLPAATRAKLLLQIAPFSDAWPMRAKDWLEESRRPHFKIALAARSRAQVAWALNRIIEKAFDETKPLLIDALRDLRRLDGGQDSDSRGETDVATMVAGLLFHNSGGRVAMLLDIGIGTPGHAGRYLVEALVAEFPDVAFDVLLPEFLKNPDRDLAWFLASSLDGLDGVDAGRRDIAAKALNDALLENGSASHIVAEVLRRLQPDSAGAWDALVAAFERGARSAFALIPIPPGKFDRALAASEAHPEEALTWFDRHAGPVAEQERLAETAKRWFETGRISAYKLGQLVETKLYPLWSGPWEVKPGDPTAPWRQITTTVIESGVSSARRCLIYLLTWELSGPMPPALGEIENLLLESGLQDDELDLYADRIQGAKRWNDADWLHRFSRLRRQNVDLWDLSMLIKYHGDPQSQSAALKFWEALPEAEHGCASREALRRHRQGARQSELFDLDTLIDIRDRCSK